MTDEDANAVDRVHSCYGIKKITIAPALDKILVDFDASRLMESEVEAVLLRYGVPIVRRLSTP